MRAEISVAGIVQGVGFRPFIYRSAVENALVGYVRNRGDAVVDIVVEGDDTAIRSFLRQLQEHPPPLARIHEIITNYTEARGEYAQFTILESSTAIQHAGSVIPPDVSVCAACLKELRDPQNRRHDYFFITCTNCGPRYTIIQRLPYDRVHTTMQEFAVCPLCHTDYTESTNRRFHAQTVACNTCGPKAYLTNSAGNSISSDDPIRDAGKLLAQGYIVAIKGNGGFHVATSTTRSEPIVRLRQAKPRAHKPFAIMARDLETIKSFAQVNTHEASLLLSPMKPIVLLKKRNDFPLSELIAPGLHTIGVMLPYTGLHFMLFDEVAAPAFIMTSANPTNQPIVIENREAIRRLGSTVDYFLFHDRMIAQRCDDSVVRIHGTTPRLIRRSRGYAPAPILLSLSSKHGVLGVGAEENVAFSLLLKNKAFISQHIGDVENLVTLTFLQNTINHLTQLINGEFATVACDRHPKFETTRFASRLAANKGCNVTPIQHHHAHLASLMGEHGIPEMVGVVCDGFGYGSDGKAWGGEILYCNQRTVQRLGHLQEQPMVGADLATRYPLRMAAGILHNTIDIQDWLIEKSDHLPHGQTEAEIILTQLDRRVTSTTTSCGRVLDAVAALLGVCYERTYQGEPAMKLEAVAAKGRDVLNLPPKTKNTIIDTSVLMCEVFRHQSDCSRADLACSTQSYLARALAHVAIETAEQVGTKLIGFTGGVAYNEQITSTMRATVEKQGLTFVTHEKVPPGDGGIAFGQAIAAHFIDYDAT